VYIDRDLRAILCNFLLQLSSSSSVTALCSFISSTFTTLSSSNTRRNICCDSFTTNPFLSVWGSLHNLIVAKNYITNRNTLSLLAVQLVVTVFQFKFFENIIRNFSVSAIFIYNQGFSYHNVQLIMKVEFFAMCIVYVLTILFAQKPHLG
jgi:hypothetical protein